jgi:hypothetical protein
LINVPIAATAVAGGLRHLPGDERHASRQWVGRCSRC